MIDVASQLASALDRNDEQPNIALAEQLATSGTDAEVAALARLVLSGDKPQRHDAIKALYELGERRPDMVVPHCDMLLDMLATKDNRMLWGAMSALAALAGVCGSALMARLDEIVAAADRGSVISKDKVMVLLSTLAAEKKYAAQVMPILLHRLTHSAVNQVPMYAELTAPVITAEHRERFVRIVSDWRDAIPYPAKKKRLDKVLRQIGE